MELWQQIMAAGLGIMVLFIVFPSVKGAIEKSKNAEEKHWGTVILLAVVLIAFVLLMISSVQ